MLLINQQGLLWNDHLNPQTLIRGWQHTTETIQFQGDSTGRELRLRRQLDSNGPVRTTQPSDDDDDDDDDVNDDDNDNDDNDDGKVVGDPVN